VENERSCFNCKYRNRESCTTISCNFLYTKGVSIWPPWVGQGNLPNFFTDQVYYNCVTWEKQDDDTR
jgi:hypothetical protein